MTLPLTYSRRKREREAAGTAKVFRTDTFGRKLLGQIGILIVSIDETASPYGSNALLDSIVKYLEGELGLFNLNEWSGISQRFLAWWGTGPASSTDKFDLHIDAIEIACAVGMRIAHERHDEYDSRQAERTTAVRDLIEQLNARMMEDSFGFQFENGQMVEVTSEYLHQETIEPVLSILAGPQYEAADQEFRDALNEFKQGNYDDAISDCGNAFESVLKVIAASKSWQTKPNDRAAQLLEHAKTNGLYPEYMDSHLNALKQLLTGIPTIRNNAGGHGAGETPRQIDKHLASYQLHQTAAAIIFLVRSAEN